LLGDDAVGIVLGCRHVRLGCVLRLGALLRQADSCATPRLFCVARSGERGRTTGRENLARNAFLHGGRCLVGQDSLKTLRRGDEVIDELGDVPSGSPVEPVALIDRDRHERRQRCGSDCHRIAYLAVILVGSLDGSLGGSQVGSHGSKYNDI
tara:strand:- start:93 stop:548 length:456 start_codon:yes stop_codon:yes gene_type:complete